ncbi:MAG: hypothetical protein AAGH88_00185 [Planctomycetota bacterium]
MKIRTAIAACSIAGFAGYAAAGSAALDLSSYNHGQILSGSNLGGVTVDADNYHNNADYLVIFDTTERGTRDGDLQGPSPLNGGWSTGNLAAGNTIVGNILIIQEVDSNFAGYTDASMNQVLRPDDEGRRSGGSQTGAGEITFSFDQQMQSFGFTLIDVEETGEFNDKTGFFATFSGGGVTSTVSFADFLDSSSSFYDPTVAFGNNSANRIKDITAEQLGLSSFDQVTINLGGSAGVGEVQYTAVPTPGAAAGGLVLLGLIAARRRRRVRD